MKNKYIALATLAAASLTSCHTTLYNAAREGDVKTVREELAEGADINKGASKANLIWQVPAVFVAPVLDVAQIGLAIGTLGIYDNLVLSKQDQPLMEKVINFSKKTPMEVATNPDVITELLLAGAQGTGWDKTKALAEAAGKGDAVTLHKLLEKSCKDRADWNNENDYKPLMLAIGGGHEECARILLEHGANFSSYVLIGGKAITCYDYASAEGQLALYKKLGGPMAEAPECIAGKKIYFDYSRAKESPERHVSEEPAPKSAWKKCASSQSWSTPVFDKNNEFTTVYSEDWSEKYGYRIIGKNTAELNMSPSGSTIVSLYTLKFETPDSGTASSHGQDCGSYIKTEGIRFTIK